MPSPEYIPITAFAKICGVTAKTLRFYDEIGLFRPAYIDPRTRYRFYLQDQLREFVQIQSMRDGGGSLAEIRAATRAVRSDSEQRRFLQKLRNQKLKAIDEARRSLAWIEGTLQELASPSPVQATITYCAPVQVASVRSHVKSYEQIQQYESLLRGAVAPLQGGLRGVIWHRCADAGPLEGESFIEVKEDRRCTGIYELKTLPGAQVARAFSSLDDQEAEDTYVGLSRWICARGYRLAAPRREIYRGNLLEIQYPLEAA
jgi:DNA-binding transcriptional MerR regulator